MNDLLSKKDKKKNEKYKKLHNELKQQIISLPKGRTLIVNGNIVYWSNKKDNFIEIDCAGTFLCSDDINATVFFLLYNMGIDNWRLWLYKKRYYE